MASLPNLLFKPHTSITGSALVNTVPSVLHSLPYAH